MSTDNVIKFPEQVEVEDDFPFAKFGYVDSVATQVFGDDIGFSCTPAKTPEGNNVVVMHVGSLQYEKILRKAIFELTDMAETRKACVVLAYEIYVLEQQHEANDRSKLLIPEKNLIIPGK